MSSPQGGGSKSQPGAVRATSTGSPKPPGQKPPPRSTGGSGGGNNRRRPPVVVVKPQRNWLPIWIGGLVAVIALGIVGYAVYNTHESGLSWEAKADKISGIVDYRKKKPAIMAPGGAYRTHTYGLVNYETTPPTYGDHNYDWQRCNGDVYPAQISNENAVHALEHGAIWITYDPTKITAAQAAQMGKTYVAGNDFTLMSPYPGESSPISLQAWGFQLRLNSPTDPRIKQFITDLRQNAAAEANTPCSSGSYITATGTTPHNLDPTQAPSAAPSAAAPSAGATTPVPAPSQS
jgi:Protein of unknown function (DUF3105)